ncbi:hypothetical protein E6C60_2613 [Paenibacillus algicola]|uniref:HTH cro/C1-type domain-containing protein n=1 Tax=Paenibacillus algicola TaxID=2565926 RepID=A0A4P8XLY2_9BACL|nr:helix-turn-helix domain-containing protein [Paenibacillus algicola]QCT03325.1 hypothetical protein E6C60_2613 [Paenibacillus algicola]
MRNNVKFLRRSKEFDMTQDQLAEALDVSRSTIFHLENGRDVSGALMLRVAKFFNKDPREIFFDDNVG